MVFLIHQGIKGFLRDDEKWNQHECLNPAPWTLKPRDWHTPRVCPALKIPSVIKEKEAWPLHKSRLLWEQWFLHIHWCKYWWEREIYTHQAQGGAFVQTQRREVSMSYPQQHGYKNNYRRQWFLWLLLSGFWMPERPPQGTVYSNYSIPLQCCWNRTFTFSQKLRIVYYHCMFWDNGVQQGKQKTGNRRPVHLNHCPSHSLKKYLSSTHCEPEQAHKRMTSHFQLRQTIPSTCDTKCLALTLQGHVGGWEA